MLIKVDDHNAIYSDTCVVRGAPVYDDSRHLALLNPILCRGSNFTLIHA